jgi:hypothetical protein
MEQQRLFTVLVAAAAALSARAWREMVALAAMVYA